MGAQLGQLSPPEVAIGQLGMRNDKVGVGYLPGAELDDIEIKSPRTPTLDTTPSLRLLYRLASLEQRSRLQTRLQEHHLIEIWRLLHAAKRESLLDGGRADQLGFRQLRQGGAGSLKVGGTVAEVAA
jgi:hypothetical protein